ncbi:LysR family transcriptional regulator [Bordetella ansorpii]|uniref:LysR family transcriptional regulator n=1 Tax=Bordetella ansorpii TaxID=288768 RepID=A0A157LSM6_9BORD|nr:LysR family transcriptional regulator [Bordetella ansorpii]SAH99688.1 LysR family transcriptional regulator [Bordetella ansorpii]
MKACDLHLLPHFSALMTHRNVSKAAAQLGISQPSMSAALSRLRHLFGDSLLTREGNQWTPTERALALHHSFGPFLDTWLSASTRASEFDWKTESRTFDIYASDYLQFAALPRIIGKLKEIAPNLTLRMLPPRLHGGQEMLTENHIELYLGYYPDPPGSLRARYLFEEEVCCVVRQDHPVLARSWNLDAFLAYEHVDTSGHAGYFSTQIDAALRETGQLRRTGAVLSSYLAVPFVLAQSDMLAILPSSVGQALASVSKTTVLPIPLKLPKMRISMFWHERNRSDGAHAWLRNFIATELETQREPSTCQRMPAMAQAVAQ